MADLFNINPKHVDVDYLNTSAIPGYYGAHYDSSSKGASPAFKSEWIIPRDERRDMIEYIEEQKLALPNYRIHWNNQTPESSCVHNAAEVVRDTMRNKQLGTKWAVKCSPMSSYCRVTTRRHSGSMMWGALQVLKAGKRGNGQLPEINPRNVALFGDYCVHQNTPFIYNNGRNHFEQNWEDIAQWFTVVEWYEINSYEEFISALIHGWGVCYGRSGHSIAGLQAVMYKGQACCKYLDSYGHGRGDDGYLIDTPRMMSTGGAWCCREVTLPPDLSKPWEPCGYLVGVNRLSRDEFLALDGLGQAA